MGRGRGKVDHFNCIENKNFYQPNYTTKLLEEIFSASRSVKI